jgi:hypothetical protein
MQLHPAVAFGAALAGAALSGLIGAFMALPAAAVIQSTVSTYLKRHEVVDTELTRGDEAGLEAAKQKADEEAGSKRWFTRFSTRTREGG